MRIDFNEIASMTFPGMDNGTGMTSARMYNDESGKYDFRVVDKSVAQNGDFDHHKGLVFKILNITGGFNTKVLHRPLVWLCQVIQYFFSKTAG